MDGVVTNVENLDGTEVQGWLLTKSIGRGADGIVYAGQKEGMEAAVKIFFPEALAKNGIPAAYDRMELQLSLVGKKHHPNLVEVFEGGEAAELETLFLVMELVPGTSLDKLIGRMPPSFVVPLARQLASAAKYLEVNLQLVHRDIKPANIVISDDFQTLTLLDLGIVYQQSEKDDQGRLSGMEFVATTRYSPPEFVWRTEQENIDGSWQAVTLYQIGATLHDMIMGKLLFAGYDTPRACLYDAVRDHTPVIESNEVDEWLIQTVQACLLKDWRQRLQLVSWENFSEQVSVTDTHQREKRIRLLQIRNEEIRQAAEKQAKKAPSPTREQELWKLNNELVLELRHYLQNTPVFPKCAVIENIVSAREYAAHFQFESDLAKGFQLNIEFIVSLGADELLKQATKLSFRAMMGGKIVSAATWTEMFSVETAFTLCQQSFLDSVESMLAM